MIKTGKILYRYVTQYTINYKFLTKLNYFRPLAKRGGTITGLTQL